MVAKTLLLALAISVAAPTALHLRLERSQPEADATLTTSPENIHLWFNQELEAGISRIALEGPAGAVETGETVSGGEDGKSMMTTLPELADGTYEVSWRAAGDDGHPVRGTYTFTVQAER